MPKLPQVEKCCFVVPLRIGTIIIGVIQVVLGTLALIFLLSVAVGISDETNEMSEGKEDGKYKIAQFVSSLYYAIFGTLLLVGTFNKDKTLLKIWLAVQGFVIVLAFFSAIGYIIYGFHWINSLEILISEVFQIYTFFVVYSYHESGQL